MADGLTHVHLFQALAPDHGRSLNAGIHRVDSATIVGVQSMLAH